MITLKDCIDYCELSKKTVDAIAERNHEPTIVSIAHGEYLLSSKDGQVIIEKYLINDIPAAYKTEPTYEFKKPANMSKNSMRHPLPLNKSER